MKSFCLKYLLHKKYYIKLYLKLKNKTNFKITMLSLLLMMILLVMSHTIHFAKSVLNNM